MATDNAHYQDLQRGSSSKRPPIPQVFGVLVTLMVTGSLSGIETLREFPVSVRNTSATDHPSAELRSLAGTSQLSALCPLSQTPHRVTLVTEISNEEAKSELGRSRSVLSAVTIPTYRGQY